jgi:tetratricopeptide (TPR) repeat protein
MRSICILLLLPGLAFAQDKKKTEEGDIFPEKEFDEIILRIGTSFHGTIQNETETEVILKMKNSPLENRFQKGEEPENIKSISYRFTRRDSYVKELEAVGDDVDKNYELAHKCQRSELPDEYAQQLKRVVELDETHLKAYQDLLSHYGKVKDMEGELETCLNMREQELESLDMVLRMGQIYKELGLGQWAYRELKKVLDNKPSHTQAKLDMADLYRMTGKPIDALQLYEEVLKKKPRSPAALVGKGRLAFDRGRYTQARALFEKATKSNPKFTPARFRLGLAHLAAGDPASAAESLKEVPEESDLAPHAWVHSAFAEAALGKSAKAEELMKKAEEKFSESQNKLLQAFIYENLKDADAAERAMTVYEQVVENDPELYFAQLGLARSLVNAGKVDNALAILPRVIRMNPDFWPAQAVKGIAHLDLSKFEEAVDELVTARDLRTKTGAKPDTALMFGIGYALLGTGRAEDARGFFRDVLQIEDEHAAAKAGIAFIQAGGKDLSSMLAKAAESSREEEETKADESETKSEETKEEGEEGKTPESEEGDKETEDKDSEKVEEEEAAEKETAAEEEAATEEKSEPEMKKEMADPKMADPKMADPKMENGMIKKAGEDGDDEELKDGDKERILGIRKTDKEGEKILSKKGLFDSDPEEVAEEDPSAAVTLGLVDEEDAAMAEEREEKAGAFSDLAKGGINELRKKTRMIIWLDSVK